MRFISFTGMLAACMAFELSTILIPLIASLIVIVLKEKHTLVNTAAILIMLGCFLYLKIAFKVGWSMFSGSGSKFSSSGVFQIK